MRVGEKAPDFSLKDQDGAEFILHENIKSPVVLIFYPADESLVCTKQLCDYDDHLDDFSE